MGVSTVPESSREERLRHPTQPATDESAILRYAYWHLPHLELDRSRELAARTSAAARQRAPFGVTGLWSAVRYWKTKPIVISVLDFLTRLGNLWPGFALLLCPWLRLNRATCYVLAAMYVADAVLLSGVTVTEPRYHAVWMVADTTLAAAVPTVILAGLFQRVRSFRRRAEQVSCGVGVLE